MYACNVKSFIYYEHHPNDYVMEHTHNCYECVFYLGGKGMITADNDLEEYDGPTITIVRPGIKHDETTKEFSRLFIVLFEFKKDELFKPFTKLKLDKEMEEVFLNLFSKMQEEEKNKKAFYRNMISSYFSLVLCHLLRKVYKIDNKASYNEELVNRTKNYIKENYNQKIDFEQIASSFGYSYHRFRHIFQKETNTSINQYLLNCKLYAAKQAEQDAKISSERRLKIGTGERSEKIRTYNYPQNRVTDHRIGFTVQKLDRVMEGDLDEILNALIDADQQDKLAGEN